MNTQNTNTFLMTYTLKYAPFCR